MALQYKRLLMVEQFYSAAKSLPHTRPIDHQWEAAIKGHVFVNVLALMLVDEMRRRLRTKGCAVEWNDVKHDLTSLCQVEVRQRDQTYLLKTALRGTTVKVLQAVGVGIPPSVQAARSVVSTISARPKSPEHPPVPWTRLWNSGLAEQYPPSGRQRLPFKAPSDRPANSESDNKEGNTTQPGSPEDLPGCLRSACQGCSQLDYLVYVQ